MSEGRRISYNLKQAEDATGLSTRTLENMCKAKQIKAVKIRRRWLIDAQALRMLITGEVDDGRRVQEA